MAIPSYEYSGVCYITTAGQTTFALTTTGGNAIGYLESKHIKVRWSDDAGNTWNSLALNTGFVFTNPATSITLTSALTTGAWLDIHRETPATEDYIKFNEGSLLTAAQLNEFDTWQLYIDQEILDRVENLTAPDINLANTDDLPEGSTNLYYTDARVQTVIDAQPVVDVGVTKIKAGNNVSISPTSGVGEVTITAAGGGGGGIPEAPLSGGPYGRQSAGWTELAIPPAQVQSDWSVTDTSSVAYIKHKPSIPSTPTLQEVTEQGNTTDRDITVADITATAFRIDQLTAITSTSP